MGSLGFLFHLFESCCHALKKQKQGQESHKNVPAAGGGEEKKTKVFKNNCWGREKQGPRGRQAGRWAAAHKSNNVQVQALAKIVCVQHTHTHSLTNTQLQAKKKNCKQLLKACTSKMREK